MVDDVEEDSLDMEEFDLEGFTQEEVKAYNSMAEPGQRLEDAVTPKRMREIMHSTSREPSKRHASSYNLADISSIQILPSLLSPYHLFPNKSPSSFADIPS